MDRVDSMDLADHSSVSIESMLSTLSIPLVRRSLGEVGSIPPPRRE
jgi:hypothetical protein